MLFLFSGISEFSFCLPFLYLFHVVNPLSLIPNDVVANRKYRLNVAPLYAQSSQSKGHVSHARIIIGQQVLSGRGVAKLDAQIHVDVIADPQHKANGSRSSQSQPGNFLLGKASTTGGLCQVLLPIVDTCQVKGDKRILVVGKVLLIQSTTDGERNPLIEELDIVGEGFDPGFSPLLIVLIAKAAPQLKGKFGGQLNFTPQVQGSQQKSRSIYTHVGSELTGSH